MIKQNKSIDFYENYPVSIIICRNALYILTCIVGAVILSGFGAWAAVSYLIYSAAMTVWVMRFRCKYCYYYGKTCSSGYGRIAALLFKRGENENFPRYVKYIVPLFLVWILPVLGGLVLVVTRFSLITLSLFTFFVIISFGLSNKALKKLGCAYCRQREDCPAYKRFN